MKAFYHDFDLMRDEKYDGMIITGAPVEQMPYEDVNYWDEITTIFDWARTHVTSTLYICWAAPSRALSFLWSSQISAETKNVWYFPSSYQCTGIAHIPWF